MKAGFLLPQEVKSAMIVTGDDADNNRHFDTYPRKSKDGQREDRRSFSVS
jgi:hypothetical protein